MLNALADVSVTTKGNPTMQENQIHAGRDDCGILIADGGLGKFDGNSVYDNALAGIKVKTAGKTHFRCNNIYQGRDRGGVVVCDEGLGLFEQNEVH
jgi:hypothetical protein